MISVYKFLGNRWWDFWIVLLATSATSWFLIHYEYIVIEKETPILVLIIGFVLIGCICTLLTLPFLPLFSEDFLEGGDSKINKYFNEKAKVLKKQKFAREAERVNLKSNVDKFIQECKNLIELD